MNLYLSATVLGLAGLLGMAALGLAHGQSPGGQSPGGQSPGHHHHAGGHGHAPHLGRGHPPGSLRAATRAPGQGGGWQALLTLTSPRVLLSAVLGFGLSGLLLSALPWGLPAAALLTLALLGGLAFEHWLILPYWNALLRFQSRPAQSLGSAVQSRAEVVSDFDASGSGLVRFEFEGEVRQLLARLEPGERGRGVRLRRGDAVRIEAIDEQRNACTVSSRV
ncbi:hypothetical protein [Deinococcus sp.]|uniref:hypothetical protein n=1 Tax=Deinococcus sp. TaxID=47478 RepID=UPI003CC586EB